MPPPIKRKFVPSSSSEDPWDSTTHVCSIEEFMAGKDPFRVAPFGHIPTPYPYQQAGCTQKGADVAEALEGQYLETLRKFQINFSSISFRSTWQKTFRSEAADTLFIATHDIEPHKWLEAATEILNLFLTAGLSNSEVKVEIFNPEKMYCDTSFCLPDDNQLLEAIRDIESDVAGAVRKHMPQIWTSIAYHMRGPRKNESVRKPTVLITCEPESRHMFEKIESLIQSVAQSTKFPEITLYLEIVPGLVTLAAPPSPTRGAPPVSVTMLPNTPANGASIGVHQKNLGAGTLGGWLTVKPVNNPSAEPMLCAMTCYHVISDGDLGNQAENDGKGIGLQGKKPLSQIKIAYPAKYDGNHTRKLAEEALSKNVNPNGMHSRTLQVLDGLEAGGPIGYVKYASGHRRTSDNTRLDWALVLAPKTFRKNKPPPASVFNSEELWGGRVSYFPGPNDFITRFGAMKGGEWVAKVGRNGTTAGEVNKVYRLVHWETHKESYETDVIGITQDFADRGDSGSWVINSKHELLGMVIGLEPMSSNYGCALVTPIEVIRDDIREMIHCEIALPS